MAPRARTVLIGGIAMSVLLQALSLTGLVPSRYAYPGLFILIGVTILLTVAAQARSGFPLDRVRSPRLWWLPAVLVGAIALLFGRWREGLVILVGLGLLVALQRKMVR